MDANGGREESQEYPTSWKEELLFFFSSLFLFFLSFSNRYPFAASATPTPATPGNVWPPTLIAYVEKSLNGVKQMDIKKRIEVWLMWWGCGGGVRWCCVVSMIAADLLFLDDDCRIRPFWQRKSTERVSSIIYLQKTGARSPQLWLKMTLNQVGLGLVTFVAFGWQVFWLQLISRGWCPAKAGEARRTGDATRARSINRLVQYLSWSWTVGVAWDLLQRVVLRFIMILFLIFLFYRKAKE